MNSHDVTAISAMERLSKILRAMALNEDEQVLALINTAPGAEANWLTATALQMYRGVVSEWVDGEDALRNAFLIQADMIEKQESVVLAAEIAMMRGFGSGVDHV